MDRRFIRHQCLGQACRDGAAVIEWSGSPDSAAHCPESTADDRGGHPLRLLVARSRYKRPVCVAAVRRPRRPRLGGTGDAHEIPIRILAAHACGAAVAAGGRDRFDLSCHPIGQRATGSKPCADIRSADFTARRGRTPPSSRCGGDRRHVGTTTAYCRVQGVM